MGRLTKLQQLSLAENQLTTVPESLGQLTQLQELWLDNNRLTSVPESLGRLTQLHELWLSENRLESVPESLGQLTQLKTLSLSGNRLRSLPDSLDKLTALGQFYLHRNDALGLPPAILGPTWDDVRRGASPARPAEIIEHYSHVRPGAGPRPLNEAKLILVGRGEVGKTSIVNRLVHGKFDPNEKETDGIGISEWKLTLRGEEVRLHVWDFGGQEILHATHQFFLTPRSLYLLVLEGRKGAEDADAEYWLKMIQSFATEDSGEVSPVLVVLNKIKVQPFDLNLADLQRRYSFICGFVETDCEDNTGIKELRGAIEREADRLTHLRDLFPAEWFAIKNTLASMKATLNKNYISFDEYRLVCQKNGEGDPQKQELLAFYLHSLGIALNYKDDPRLNEMDILNPQWVTNGIYRILTSARLKKRKGVIDLAEVADILDTAEYPLPVHRFLFDLMQKFELCFTFPENDAHYLIPELLGKEEPPEAAKFESADCLNFEYRYPVLPEGLLPRFIVRTHALHSDGLCWRTGAILTFQDNRALVKADVQSSRRVSIAVTGPVVGRPVARRHPV